MTRTRYLTFTALLLGSLMAFRPASAQISGDVVRIGVINDMSGLYSDLGGEGSVEAARLAVEDFGPTVLGKKIEIVAADHQNKPDIAAITVRRWIDEEGVDAIADGGNSATALAIQGRNRLSKYPGIPTFLELGAKDPGLSLMSVTGIVAVKGVPEQVINTVSELGVEAGKDPETWEKFEIAGAEQRPIGRAEFSRWVTEEGPVWHKLTSALGLGSN